MEAFYLICSATTTLLTSFTLSLFLFFRCLCLLIFRSITSRKTTRVDEEAEEEEARATGVTLYEGSVWHERKSPVRHAFKYSVRYALVDLDRAYHHRTFYSSFFSNHLSACQARQITSTTGPVMLLTIPSSVGYEQNPLSVYYCYDTVGSTDQLKKCIAEITNTPWGERVSFTFDPDSDLVAKTLHVSPFMDMLGNWNIRANAPGNNIFLAISVQHPKLGDYFTANLKVKRVSSCSFGVESFFWLMPQKVALWIYLQALKLWWKNVRFIQHPRYHNVEYRDQAKLRDRKLQCSCMVERDKSKCSSNSSASHNGGDRWCVWRDARWPWN